jgi:hypothetical protein
MTRAEPQADRGSTGSTVTPAVLCRAGARTMGTWSCKPLSRASGNSQPSLPLANPEAFADRFNMACDWVIVDHYLIGDGSPNGWRTK